MHDTVPGVVVMMVASKVMAVGCVTSSAIGTQAGCGLEVGDSTMRATVMLDTMMSHSTIQQQPQRAAPAADLQLRRR